MAMDMDEQRERLMAKAENFMKAIEVGKGRMEMEHFNRLRRYDEFKVNVGQRIRTEAPPEEIDQISKVADVVRQALRCDGPESQWSSVLQDEVAQVTQKCRALRTILAAYGWSGSEFISPPDREALLGRLETELARHNAQTEAFRRFAERENRCVAAKFKAISTADFESIQVLGEGSFGVVHLVRRRGTEEYYALKQLKKSGCRKKNHRDGAFAERDLLAEARSRWFVELHATFQDVDNIYMVMEFLQGGDLIGHLMKKKRFTREETRFYMAELLEALDTVHKAGFVHRDVKPDNMVLTAAGHLKLLDFGLCKADPTYVAAVSAGDGHGSGPTILRAESAPLPSRHQRRAEQDVVGTPQYMSPEAFRGACCPESDLWAIGVMTFECLVGHVPFHSGSKEGMEGLLVIREKIRRHEEVMPMMINKYVERGYICRASKKFIESLVCEQSLRHTASRCRRDPFFFNIDFPRLHTLRPPIVPEVTYPGDASQFDNFLPVALPSPPDVAQMDSVLEWKHYEFNRDAYELQRPHLDTDAIFGN